MASTTLRGIVLMCCANLSFCAMACMVRFIADLNAYATTFFRFVIGIAIVGTLAMSGRIRLNFINGKGLFLRGFTGGISTSLVFYSLTKIGLIKTGFIFNLYPVCAALFGCFILGERMTWGKATAFVAAIFGTLVLMSNSMSPTALLSGFGRYELIALSATVLAGLSVVLIKRLQSTDSTIAIFFSQCLVGLFVVAIPACIGPISITSGTLVILIIIGLLATSGQLLLTSSYRYLSVGTGSLIVMSTPLFNCAAGVLLFNEQLTIRMAVGGLIMLAASSMTLFCRE